MNFEDAKQQASKFSKIWATSDWFFHVFEKKSRIFDALYVEHNMLDSLSYFSDSANSFSILHKQKWCKVFENLKQQL